LLREAGLPRLTRGQSLVGTGGTLRNLAKIDLRSRPYPVSRLHGYLLSAERVKEIGSLLAGTRLRKREAIPGLSEDRADSIVGGSLVVVELLKAVGAEEILVSGQGVREGLAYSLLGDGVPAPRRVREAALLSLAGRFRDWRPDTSERRRCLALARLAAIEPASKPEIREALDDAARLLDIGRAVDFFDRHQHVADMVMATELNGFSHREIALLAALLRRAGDPRSEPRDLAPLVTGADRDRIERAAVLLLLADDIEERCPKGKPVAVRCRVGQRQVTLDVPSLAGWRPRGVGPRFQRAFGKALVVRPGARR
jgi:exopolyphosphatase/guanosine-5'-triphosphate,3'-diphosphate pyrophosphatase